MRFKIDWASLIFGGKFTVVALFYFVFEVNFQVQVPRGAYIWGGQFNGGFFALRVWGPTFGGDYFRNSTVVNFVLKLVLPVVLKEIQSIFLISTLRLLQKLSLS